MNGLKIVVIILISVGIAAFLYNLLALQPNLENQYAIGPVTITTTDTDYRMQSDITGLGTVGAIAIVVVAFGKMM